jgi:hypothetical protein
VLVSFQSCDKAPEIIIVEEKLILAHSLRGFSLWSCDPIVWTWGESEPHGWEHAIEQSCSHHGNQEAKRERKGVGSPNHHRGHTPSDLTSFP